MYQLNELSHKGVWHKIWKIRKKFNFGLNDLKRKLDLYPISMSIHTNFRFDRRNFVRKKWWKWKISCKIWKISQKFNFGLNDLKRELDSYPIPIAIHTNFHFDPRNFVRKKCGKREIFWNGKKIVKNSNFRISQKTELILDNPVRPTFPENFNKICAKMRSGMQKLSLT